MTKNRKKVVLLIVEGDCEEILLHQRLKNLFKQHDIRFEVQHGDILFNFEKQRKSIKSVIGDTIKQFLKKRKFKPDDLLAVIHIIDTDGCFIPQDNIKVDKSQKESIYYDKSYICVPNENQRESIILRNSSRSKNIRTMNSISEVLSGKIEYRMYYFSRNLEHVIFNEPNSKIGFCTFSDCMTKNF